ncbi:MAG: hypothetical protein IJU61_06100 [Victivallales bacterium]|nr:hypothetical protein [Bacteroidales bacterium]MBQ9446145.1 hypothetical protein [Victivallales bacterium]
MNGSQFQIVYAGQIYVECGVDAKDAWERFCKKHPKWETASYKLKTTAQADWLEFAVYMSLKGRKYYVATVMQMPNN